MIRSTTSNFGDVRAPREHFDKIVVQAVIKLSLKVPLKPSRLNFTRFEAQSIRLIVDSLDLQGDSDFDARCDLSRRPIEQGMLVTSEFSLDLFEMANVICR